MWYEHGVMKRASAPSIPASEFRDRRDRAARAARLRGLDAVLVWGRGGTLDCFSDIHYFTNHYSPMVWVPPLPGVLSGCEHAALVVADDGSGTLFVSDFSPDGVHVEAVRKGWDLAGEVVSYLQEAGLKVARIGVVGEEVLPFGVVERFRASGLNLRLEPADDLSAELRLQLSENEVALLKRAGEVGAQIYSEFLDCVLPGTTEGEAIGAALALAARIPDCAHWNFLSGSGPDANALVRRSFPPWRPDRRYEPGDSVHADCYGYVAGYCYDLARTVVVSGSDEPAKTRVAEATRDAVMEVADKLRPGVTSGLLCEAATDALAARGLTAAGGSFGHGLGAGFFRPYLVPAGPDLERPVEAPFGFSIEIFATDGSGSFAYHEDNFVVLEAETICVTAGVSA
jgi:ectoine hydrolase